MSSTQPVRWMGPDFDTPVPAAVEPTAPAAPAAPVKVGPSVEEMAAIEKAARDEGYAAGHAEGLAAAEAEIARLTQQLGALLRNFSAPLADLDSEVAEALGALSVRIAASLLDEAYSADPDRLARLVETALASVAQERIDSEVLLHPADLALLKEKVETAGLRLVADASLKRGDVRVHTSSLRLDASMETRLAAALAALQVVEAPDA